jgi:hypothetical protein
MKTNPIKQAEDTLTDERFLLHILHIESKDVTLKFLFDYVKNYATCGALLWASGRMLFSTSNSTDAPGFIDDTWRLLAGGLILAVSLVLFALNLIQGIIATSKLQNQNKINKYIHTAIHFIVCLAALRFALTF